MNQRKKTYGRVFCTCKYSFGAIFNEGWTFNHVHKFWNGKLIQPEQEWLSRVLHLQDLPLEIGTKLLDNTLKGTHFISLGFASSDQILRNQGRYLNVHFQSTLDLLSWCWKYWLQWIGRVMNKRFEEFGREIEMMLWLFSLKTCMSQQHILSIQITNFGEHCVWTSIPISKPRSDGINLHRNMDYRPIYLMKIALHRKQSNERKEQKSIILSLFIAKWVTTE